MQKSISFLCFLLLAVLTKAAVHIDVTKFGAVGDGKVMNTQAIQTAIDSCSAQGGGKVVFPAGTWLSGTLLLKTGVTLYLDEKATLLGSTDIADYKVVDGFKDGLGQAMGYCFIGAVDVQNVGLEGLGTIDGQGKLVRESGGKDRRPFLIRFVRCNNVSVKEVRLTGPTAWTLHLFRCKNIIADKVVIRSRGLGNNDGIDIDCCEDVVIRNCDIDSGDDAICFKTTSPFPCKNVLIENIHIFTREGAIKFGTESAGNFENIKVKNIEIMFAREGGIKLFSVDGSKMKNIEISDVVMHKAHLPIIVRLGARMKTFRPGDPKLEVGSISDVKIRNVKVYDGDWIGILMSGIPGHNIDGLTMENIDINVTGKGTLDDAKLKPEEKIDAYPEIYIFGRRLPAYGMYLRHAQNITMKNVNLHIDSTDARPAIIATDIANITLTDWKLSTNNSLEPLINLDAAKNIALTNITPSAKPATFLSVTGKESKKITVKQSKWGEKAAVKLADEVEKGAVVFN